jgi:hypothetical protein
VQFRKSNFRPAVDAGDDHDDVTGRNPKCRPTGKRRSTWDIVVIHNRGPNGHQQQDTGSYSLAVREDDLSLRSSRGLVLYCSHIFNPAPFVTCDTFAGLEVPAKP